MCWYVDITLHMDITHIHHTSHAFVICICVYVRSTLGISLDALNLSLYAAVARPILFIVSGNSVPRRTGERAAPRCDRTASAAAFLPWRNFSSRFALRRCREFGGRGDRSCTGSGFAAGACHAGEVQPPKLVAMAKRRN